MKKIFFNLFLFALCFSVFGQEKQDSINSSKANKWNANVGIAFSLITSKQINTSLSVYGNSLLSLSYTTQYYGVKPQLSFFVFARKKKFIVKNEILYTNIGTRFSYTDLYYHYNPNGYWNGKYIIDYNYQILNYKTGIGMQFNRLFFLAGFYLGYFISGKGHFESVYGTGDNYFSFSLKRHFSYGANIEVNYLISKKWYFGIGTSLSNKVSKYGTSIFDKYQIHSIQFSIGRNIIKNTTK